MNQGTAGVRMHKVTEQWIRDHATAKGGWKRRQLELIGERWPPKPGWIDKAVGREITDEQRAEFESMREGR